MKPKAETVREDTLSPSPTVTKAECTGEQAPKQAPPRCRIAGSDIIELGAALGLT